MIALVFPDDTWVSTQVVGKKATGGWNKCKWAASTTVVQKRYPTFPLSLTEKSPQCSHCHQREEVPNLPTVTIKKRSPTFPLSPQRRVPNLPIVTHRKEGPQCYHCHQREEVPNLPTVTMEKSSQHSHCHHRQELPDLPTVTGQKRK